MTDFYRKYVIYDPAHGFYNAPGDGYVNDIHDAHYYSFKEAENEASLNSYLTIYREMDSIRAKEIFEPEEPAKDQWDEKLRGPKMSSSSGRVIFKYQMPVLEEFTMKLPRGAEIIRMADQGGMFWMWAVVDTREPDEERKFYAVKCGANVPEKHLIYRGFCAIHVQQELGLYIFESPNEKV